MRLMEKVKERLFYIDNLRLLVIIFVVMHHLAVTYSGLGGFYYIETRPLDKVTTAWFAFYLSFQQAYFMGFLFMISGYFVAGSYDRKGFGKFTGERFKRLIVPALIYMVVITPFIGLVELGQRPGSYNLYDFLSGTGVLWFTVALFIFSLVYGAGRLVIHRPAADQPQFKLSVRKALLLILAIAVCAFLIRIVQPIGTNILNMQLCYFASYIILFAMGIFASRNHLFARISYKAGKWWLISAIGLGLFSWLVLVIAASLVPGGTDALLGGFTWESALFAVWESFVAVAMAIGLIAVFREKWNRQSRLVKTLSDNSFAVYMFHPVILTAVTLWFSPVTFTPVVKWIIMCIVCVPLCFAATHFVFRRIPLLKNVL